MHYVPEQSTGLFSEYTDAETERTKFKQAVFAFEVKTACYFNSVKALADKKTADVFSGYNAIVNDPVLEESVFNEIDYGKSAAAAVELSFNRICEKLKLAESPLIQSRISDFLDIKNSLISIINNDIKPVEPASGSVVVAKELFPSDISFLQSCNVAAVVAERGGYTSHSAILLRALGIPAVFGVCNALKAIKKGDMLLVNGEKGEVVINPEKAQIVCSCSAKNTGTYPENVKLLANISSAKEVTDALNCGAEGIGLFRSEYLFLNRAYPPSEEEQIYEYSAIAKAFGEKETVLRTLDIGGDKSVSYLPDNERGIRLCLNNPEIFKAQLRAMLCAAALGNVKILLPFVTKTEELERAKMLINECCTELEKEKRAFRRVPVGAMIETPSAVFISDLLAENADFFSVGTNDLFSLVMAMERSLITGTEMYESVFRAVRIINENANKNGIPVTVCGEAAENPFIMQKICEIGINTFSLNPIAVKKIKAG